jgi:hypothetical protein
MKTILFVMLSLFSSIVFADAVADHKAALKGANAAFTVAFEKCDDAVTVKERNKCRGIAKREHTKAVERADALLKVK